MCVSVSVCMYGILIHISNIWMRIYQIYQLFYIQMIEKTNSEFSGSLVQNRHLSLEDHWRNQRQSSAIRVNTEQENPDAGIRGW